MSKVKTFAITFRPLNGVDDNDVDKINAWIVKRSLYYHVITEKTGSERHVHAAMIFHTEVTRSQVTIQMKRLFPNLSTDEHKVFMKGIRVMYNEDFIKAYMDKSDDTVVISSNLPEAGTIEHYFPPPLASLPSKSKNRYYHELMALWRKHVPPHVEVNTKNARHFLFKMMYSLDAIAVLRDDKAIIQTAKHLCRFLRKEEYCTFELPCFDQEEYM